MKSVAVFFIIFSLLAPLYSQELKQGTVWGKVVKLPKDETLFGFKYYIFYEDEEGAKAYPVENPKALKKELIGRRVKLKGSVKQKTIKNKEVQRTVLVFSVKDVKLMELKDLALTSKEMKKIDVDKNNFGTKGKADNRGGIEISDTAANVAIFAAGAALIGTMIKDYADRN